MRAPKSPVQSRTNAVKAGAIGLIGVLLSFPVVMAAGGLVAWVIWLVRGEPVDMIAHETLRLFMDNPVDGWYIAMVVMVLIIAPMMEEVMYRGLMQTALVEFGIGRWPAIGVTSAIFALMHAGIAAPHALVALFVFSLGLGCVYERTGRLVAPIVMHAVFNAANEVAASIGCRARQLRVFSIPREGHPPPRVVLPGHAVRLRTQPLACRCFRSVATVRSP